MQPHIAQALKDATSADLLDILGEIVEPSRDGPLGKSYQEDALYEGLMDELIPVTTAYHAVYERLAATVEHRRAA